MTDGAAAPRYRNDYERYRQGALGQPECFPLRPLTHPERYRPIAPWMGRLILPAEELRASVQGVLFEVHHAEDARGDLVGQVIPLRWSDDPSVQAMVRAVTRDVRFNRQAQKTQAQGFDHPVRVNGWNRVDPLESLAAAHPFDDVIVALRGPVIVQDDGESIALYVAQSPLLITGRYYGLVTFSDATDHPCVRHFNPTTGRFDGPTEIVRTPEAVSDQEGIWPSTMASILSSPRSADGWYVYGSPDGEGTFVVQAVLPRVLLRPQSEEVKLGADNANHYIRRQVWKEIVHRADDVVSVRLEAGSRSDETERQAVWKEGDRALVLHGFGRHRRRGVLGKLRKPGCLGHFAFGIAEVARDPLSGELRFDIVYHQVYAHNTQGVISGTNAHAHYLGDRQFGFLGYFPVVDILFKLDAVSEDYDFDGLRWSPLDELARNLEIMEARYRIGDGTGGAYVGPANNCAQDSNQTLYTTIRRLPQAVREQAERQDWAERNPAEAERLERLIALTAAVKRRLFPRGGARSDWRGDDDDELGSTFQDSPLTATARAILTWRTILPRVACETIAAVLLEHGASAWVLGTSLVGGENDKIEPVPPLHLG